MKHLYLVRHAKSSWDFPDLDDFDRPLNARGERDAPRMAKRFKELKIVPDLIVTSPAARARTTCRVFAEILDIPTSIVMEDENLYHAGTNEILSIVKSSSEKHNIVMMFGHNPGLTDLANRIGNVGIDNIPTTGIVGLQCKISSWKELKPHCGELEFFDFPKKYK